MIINSLIKQGSKILRKQNIISHQIRVLVNSSNQFEVHNQSHLSSFGQIRGGLFKELGSDVSAVPITPSFNFHAKIR